MNILIATEKPFAPEAVSQIKEIVESSGHQLLLLENYTSRTDLINACQKADALIVRSDIVDAEVIKASENLKIIVRAGAGYDNVDLDTATINNVCVMNTPGQNANAVAEIVFGMLIYLVRWGFNGSSGSELKGKRIGLHAFGHIAKATAHIANGFGMTVYAYSPTLARNPELGKQYNVKPVKSPEELYDNSDIISLHMPITNDTKEIINYDLISRLPANGVIINTARKEVVNEADLSKIMEERPLFKYATDIRPNNHEEMLQKFANRYIAPTKKCGAQTAEANINAGLAAAKQIVKFFSDNDVTFKVN